ncbi:MAG: nuclear transport factor 2 family protein [Mycobacterium sp.]
MPAEDWADLTDREKIRDRLARLSRGLDRRDADLIRTSYWPEAIDDQGVAVTSVDDLVAWVVPGDPAVLATLHTLGQSLIELRGATALVETPVTAYHRIATGTEDRDVVLGGRYLDRLEKRDHDWRILHRKLVSDWQSDLGQSADWSKGLLGMPFKSDDAVGAVAGDASHAFFGRAPG